MSIKSKTYNQVKQTFLFIIVASFIFLYACSKQSPYSRINGLTQGTTYHITFHNPGKINPTKAIQGILSGVDSSMSVHNPRSLISRFNTSDSMIIMDEHMKKVISTSFTIHKLSEGVFDITVGPLVNAWGFGPGKKQIIDSSVIDSIKTFTGMGLLSYSDSLLMKQDKRVSIDLNAIAQGYTVDTVAGYFESVGIKHYLIEIGGELRAKGKNPYGKAWQIGIDKPIDSNMIPGNALHDTIELREGAMATSGNYRKFYIKDGIKYSHSIDPATGYPSVHRLLSATVIGKSCMNCDALATACMVSGLKKSKQLLKKVTAIKAYLIYNDDQGDLQVYKYNME